MNLRYWITTGAALVCGVALSAADGVAVAELYRSEIAKFEAAPQVAVPRDADAVYQARFFLKDRGVLVTLTAFSEMPMTELNGGSGNSGDSEISFEGLPPTVASICVEVRSLKNGSIEVRHFDLGGADAKEMDEFLRFTDVFSLGSSPPWFFRTAPSGEIIFAQLATGKRIVEVARPASESLPFEAITKRLDTLLARLRNGKETPCLRTGRE